MLVTLIEASEVNYVDHLLMRRPDLDHLPPMPELPHGYLLRTYRTSDLEPLAIMMQRAFQDTKWTPDRLREALIDAPDVLTTYIVEYNGAPVASASVRVLPDKFPGSGYVHWVACDPDHRRKGLGYAVTLATLYEFARLGLKDAVLETDDHRLAAIRMYHRIGFVEEHTAQSHLLRWAAIADMLAAANL